jgi:AcrR family transcriptional regulator
MASPTAARIAEAARRILATEGSAAVTMRRVAGDADVTPMAIYRHYANREELLRTIADTTFDELDAAWRVRSPTATDARGRLAATVDAHLDFALGQPNLYEFLFTELRQEPDRSPARAALAAALAGLVAAADVDRVALVLTAELQGLIQLYRGGRIGMAEPDFRAFCHEAVARILDGPAA